MVAVLFARRDSHYKALSPHVWDEDRNALTYTGSMPVVAHPPCRGWGRLKAFAKIQPGELELGIFGVLAVRTWGGVLEHPASSGLFPATGCPAPGQRDEFGGFCLPVDQSWWGHRAPKPTTLYIVGVDYDQIPEIPFHLGTASGRIENMGKKERETTPPDFAQWLVDLASKAKVLS